MERLFMDCEDHTIGQNFAHEHDPRDQALPFDRVHDVVELPIDDAQLPLRDCGRLVRSYGRLDWRRRRQYGPPETGAEFAKARSPNVACGRERGLAERAETKDKEKFHGLFLIRLVKFAAL